MKDYWFTPLFIFFIIHYGSGQSTNTHSADALTCVNDYKKTISCVWWRATNFSGQQCELTGISKGSSERFRCDLQPISSRSHSTRRCSLTLDSKYFFFTNRFELGVSCNGSDISKQSFSPGRHVKTQPPDQPTVNTDNITWSKGKNFPERISDCEFQLQFKAAHASWETARLSNITHGSFLLLDHSLLTVGEQYQARVRTKPVEPRNEGYLRGQWSDWSPAVSWTSAIGKTPVDPDDDTSTVPVRGVILIIGFLILIVLTVPSLFIYKANKSSRLMKPKPQHVPDPSKYFQPLHTVHGGNFRRWLGCQNSNGPFLTPQLCDDISPVEVSDTWDVSLLDPDAPLSSDGLIHFRQGDSGLENSGTSHASSSGFSNMGYFYSKSNTGSLYLESCPVYFSYHPDDGTGSTLSSPGSSCDSLHIPNFTQPLSPDSGLEMPEADRCKDGAEKAEAEGKALVSFIMSLSQGPVPHESLAPGPTLAPVKADSCSSVCEPAEGAGVRPASMIEPCGSGYLTLKEMQKYSNKSI